MCFPESSSLAATPRTSKVTLLNPRSSYSIGDIVKVRVDVHDERGVPKHRGGDEVRVWLSEKTKKAGVAGRVRDLKNGSYIADIRVRWKGVQKVSIHI